MSYTKKIWSVGEHLKASQISEMSAALAEVVEKVEGIEIPEVPSLEGYAKIEDIPEVPSLEGYAKIEDIPAEYDDTDIKALIAEMSAKMDALARAVKVAGVSEEIVAAAGSEGTIALEQAGIEGVFVAPSVSVADLVFEDIAEEFAETTVSGKVVVITGASDKTLTFEII